MSKYQWKVQREQAGTSLLQFIKSKLQISGRKIKHAIESNRCTVNGKVERHASVKLREGTVITFIHEEINKPKSSLDKSRIIFEDDALFVYNKPAGITSDDPAFNSYKLVHRLDKPTTGVILYGKTPEAEKSLLEQFRNREVKKEYLALVDGQVREKSGTVENRIGKISEGKWGIVKTPLGKQATTEWKCTQKGKKASLIECYPITGRTHQIRLHMKAIGHPILGDFNYERNYACSFHPRRCMLHAYKIRLKHPTSGESVLFIAPIPEDFREAMKAVL